MQPYTGYAVISAICILMGLVAFGKINPKAYPYLLYAIAAGMVLMITMAAQNTVLADTHLEYYYARLHAGEAVWIPIINIPQDACIGNTIIAPFLNKAFGIPLLDIYRVVYPLVYCFVPVILYFIYRKWLSEKKAFLASALCIIFPSFFMEVSTIPRQMLAEVALALLLYFIIINSWKLRYRLPLIGICAVLLTPLSYSIGLVSIGIFGTGVVLSLILRYRRYLLPIGLAFALIVATVFTYLPLTNNGNILLKLGHTYNQIVPDFMDLPLPDIEPDKIKPPLLPPAEGMPTRSYYESLMQVGLGFDFMETTNAGRIFRVLQWIMFVLLIVGLWFMRKNKEYWVLASGFIVITLLCLVPGWASLLNSTRFVHLSLFLLAPLLVVAGKKDSLLLIFLIPYFLFSSGLVFEAIGQTRVYDITIPYNIGLSDYRVDLGADFNEDDVAVREYLLSNNLTPVTADVFGAYFIQDTQGSRGDLLLAFQKVPTYPEEGYILIRSRNVREGTLTVWWGIGCRKFIPIEEFGININENIVYQVGDARILEVINED